MRGASASTELRTATLAVYERWAASYPPAAHNPLMRAEEAVMRECLPPIAGQRVLDLACGSGRYSLLLADRHPEDLVALDLCHPMLAQVTSAQRVRASMTQLPFANRTFDVVICALAIGHVTNLAHWMAEVARVLNPDGILLYSDFHPAAAHAGLPRTFKDEHDELVTVPHRIHELAQHREAATAAGLTLETLKHVRAGIELTEAFNGSVDFYRRWHGLPVVLVARARR